MWEVTGRHENWCTTTNDHEPQWSYVNFSCIADPQACELSERVFERIRTIKGRRYRYREKRWREGGKVRSKSWCLGALDWSDQPKYGHGGYLEQMEQYPWPREDALKENSPDKSGEKAGADMVGEALAPDGSPDSPS